MLIGVLQYRISLSECAPCKCLEAGTYLECVSRPFFPKINEYPDLTVHEKAKIVVIRIGNTIIQNLPHVTRMEYPELNDFYEYTNPSISCADLNYWFFIFSDIDYFVSDTCDITLPTTLTMVTTSVLPSMTTQKVPSTHMTGDSETTEPLTSQNVPSTHMTSDSETTEPLTLTIEFDTTTAITSKRATISLIEIIALVVGCVLVIVIIILCIMLYKRKKVENGSDDIIFSNPMFDLEEIEMAEMQNVTSDV